MKTKGFAIGILLAASLVSCSKEQNGASRGTVSFSVAGKDAAVAEVTKSRVSDYTALPSSSAFTIVVKDADNAEVYSGLISDWDAATDLAVGDYTVTASYGAEGVEGFDKPYFAGSTTFSVVGGQTTEVSVPVALANMLVKVSVTEQFSNYFPDYDFTVTTGSGTVISFPKGETRAAFVDAYKFTVTGSLTAQNGTERQLQPKEYNANLEAKTCYTLLFEASNVGGVKVTVTFNDTTETVDLGEFELNE